MLFRGFARALSRVRLEARYTISCVLLLVEYVSYIAWPWPPGPVARPSTEGSGCTNRGAHASTLRAHEIQQALRPHGLAGAHHNTSEGGFDRSAHRYFPCEMG